MQELAELTGILSGMEKSFARETIEAQLRVLLGRINKAPADDRPIQPLRGVQHGISEYGLTRTGRYDLRSGDHVRIHALSGRSALNGCAGVVVEPGFDHESGRWCVRVDHGGVGAVRVRPAHLQLVLYAWDETAVQFVRPSGALTSKTVGWCRTNGFDEVRSGEYGGPVYAGPWWEEMEAVDRARVLAHVAMAVDDAEGGGEGDDVHDDFLKGLSAGCVGMEIDSAEGEGQADDADDDFADLAHGVGFGLIEGLAGREFEQQLENEWSFSPDDLDSLASLAMPPWPNWPLPFRPQV